MPKANKYGRWNGWGKDKPKLLEPRKGLLIKEIGPNLTELRNLLALPANFDIAEEAKKGQTFEECLGIIAARMNILLEGFYDVEKLCEVLCAAINRRNVKGMSDDPHLQHPALIPARVEEREDAINIETAKLPAARTVSEAEVVKHNIFMLEHGCKVCDDRRACIDAQKCLGREEGFGIQTKE